MRAVKAVIMAGGEGTRLRPLTSRTPKPLLPVANRPMLEHVVELVRRHGIEEILITVGFMADVIRNHFGDGSEFGVRIDYVNEAEPLGTAGSVANARDRLDDRFLVLSGDVVTDVDLGRLLAEHERRALGGAWATIGLVRVPDPVEFGVVVTAADGTVERFVEKPGRGQVLSDAINTGVYVLEPRVLDLVPAGRSVDFSAEVFPELLRRPGALHGVVLDGYWEDVGTLGAYLRVHRDALDGHVALEIPGFAVANGHWLGEGAEVHPDAVVDGPVVIGAGSRIGRGCRLGEYVVIGSNVRLMESVDVERSVLHDNVFVASGARLRGAVLGRGADVRSNARLGEGVVLGDDVRIGAGAVLAEGVRVYPSKTVDDGAVVNSSIVWESRGARRLFGRDGVVGLANVDVTPEVALRVAMAYGTSLPKGATVVASRDSSRSARMLKRAVMAGLNATGVNVLDLEVATVPVTRFVVRSPRAAGGISVRLLPGDPRQVVIRFFDGGGTDLGTTQRRRIERLVQREEHRRSVPEEVGDIGVPARALEEYAVALEASVDLRAIRRRRFTLVVDYSFGAMALVMPDVLAKVGADVLAINPYQSTSGMIAFEPRAAAERVAGHVRSSGADLGAVIGPDGERLTLIDDRGVVLDGTELLLSLVELHGRAEPGSAVAVPVNVSDRVEAVADRHGVDVRRTPLAPSALMEVVEGTGLAGDANGGIVVPAFLPAFDAAAALVRVLDLCARTGASLSEVRAGLPPVHLVHETVATSWERTGQVMRSVLEAADGLDPVLIDGVRIPHPAGWSLVAPDPHEPHLHVWAESTTAEQARRLADGAVELIRRLGP